MWAFMSMMWTSLSVEPVRMSGLSVHEMYWIDLMRSL